MKTTVYRRVFQWTVGVHGVLLIAMVVAPWMQDCRRRREKPPEMMTHVSFQMESAPPAPVTPDPAPPAPAPPTPPPPTPPPPEPAPPPKPRLATPDEIRRSQDRVRREAPRPPPVQPPAPTAEELRRSLQQGLPSPAMTAPTGVTLDLPPWYYAQVKDVLYAAWQQPSGLAAARGRTVRWVLRVGRDGRILQRTLRSGSGLAALDDSVQRAVQSVSALPKLPAGYQRPEAEITVDFQLEGSF